MMENIMIEIRNRRDDRICRINPDKAEIGLRNSSRSHLKET